MNIGIKTALALALAFAGTIGIAAAQDYGYYNRGNYGYYDRGDFREGMRTARQFGWSDGSQVAREDMWRGKPFNPNPRGPYDDADRGYRREFGSIHQYRERYSQAYRQAYASTFRNRGYYR
ncbi:MAG TPA: hypothetical protein VJ731_00680 [Terriglobales bacterium]|nr:hypothetical protein [Terriglobales bacterium]